MPTAESFDTATKCEALERVVGSRTLQGSESLLNVLRYLAQRSIESPGETAREHCIAADVLGRRSGFDPRTDSTVRVTVARLRSKLTEYYQDEGRRDPIRVEVPKGAYQVVFHRRRGWDTDPTAEEPHANPRETAAFVPQPPAEPVRWARPGAIASMVGFCAALLGLVAGYALRPVEPQASPAFSSPAVERFWAQFKVPDSRPIIVYSNAQFVGRAYSTGLRYYDVATHGPSEIVDTYTGVGEVMAVRALSQTFWSLRQEVDCKRAGLLDWDQARDTNLIFIGGPSENMSVREFRELREEAEFAFEPVADPRGDYGAVIINRHPFPGELPVYDGSRNEPGRRDFAVVRLTNGFRPDRRVLLLAGVTTQGTQAAAEFVCRGEKLADLLSRLGVGNQDPISPFECVLQVDMSGGVPVDSRVVALRRHPETKSSSDGGRSVQDASRAWVMRVR